LIDIARTNSSKPLDSVEAEFLFCDARPVSATVNRVILLGRVGLRWHNHLSHMVIVGGNTVGRLVVNLCRNPPMSVDSPVAYVGDADFHDGSILTVEVGEGTARVRIRGYSGKFFTVSFRGVVAVRANRPEGMVLYGLCELRSQSPVRRFCFANWNVGDDASLEIDATEFAVLEG
jgi:hypothetical protein